MTTHRLNPRQPFYALALVYDPVHATLLVRTNVRYAAQNVAIAFFGDRDDRNNRPIDVVVGDLHRKLSENIDEQMLSLLKVWFNLKLELMTYAFVLFVDRDEIRRMIAAHTHLAWMPFFEVPNIRDFYDNAEMLRSELDELYLQINDSRSGSRN